MSLDNDFVDVVGLYGVEPTQCEVIDDEKVGREESSERFFVRVIGSRLLELKEHLVGADKEDVVSGATSSMSEGGGKESFADANVSHEQGILLGLEEGEREEISNAMSVEANRGIPVETLEGLLLGKAGAFESPVEIGLVASVDLVLEHKL